MKNKQLQEVMNNNKVSYLNEKLKMFEGGNTPLAGPIYVSKYATTDHHMNIYRFKLAYSLALE